MTIRTRQRRIGKIVVQVAIVLVFLTTTGCDEATTNAAAAGAFNFVGGMSSAFVASLLQVAQQNFPSADILQALLGGNNAPFFTG